MKQYLWIIFESSLLRALSQSEMSDVLGPAFPRFVSAAARTSNKNFIS